ncbi:hypothetical protein BLNAU_21025 [Blattamonas nauphoetae]|uniref:Uncharacterized protein n=1 Tax=Blattamonas nauphoetae TaxID=2049346 RepID=A0ABQ9WWZ6_9EUKA|nr:hypothetical protein BLNAU_21025 [Blattamonas nauphoetae]
MSATIQPPQLVTLSNTSFVSGNSTASTRSGVLDVTLSEGSTFTLTHSSKPFPSCSSPKATTNLIFISHPSLSESVLSSSLDFDWTTGSDSLADFAVKEGDHPVSVTLFLYFSSLGDEMIISNDSCDVSVCGFSEYPCASLTAFHSRIGDTPDKTVTFRTSIDHSAELTLTEGTTLAGNEQHLVIKETSTSETPNSLFTIRANMSIEQLFVEIPSTFQHSSLLKYQSGSLGNVELFTHTTRLHTHPIHSDPDSLGFKSQREPDILHMCCIVEREGKCDFCDHYRIHILPSPQQHFHDLHVFRPNERDLPRICEHNRTSGQQLQLSDDRPRL